MSSMNLETTLPQKPAKATKGPSHNLQVGSILVAEWGATMCMVSFYQVRKLLGNQTVEIVEIVQDENQIGFLTGRTEPMMPIQVRKGNHREFSDGEYTYKKRVKNGLVYVQPYIIAKPHNDGETYLFDHCD